MDAPGQTARTAWAHWRGPHSGIIAAPPGLLEYRQIHVAETKPGRRAAATSAGLAEIKHVVVLMQENRSFDH